MTRRPHSRFHDGAVALIAVTALLWGYIIGTWLNQDPAPENPPSDGAATPDPDRIRAALGASRDAGRSVPPLGLTRQTPPDRNHDRETTVPTVGKPSVRSGGVPWPWQQLAACESSGDWQANTGNGYWGGLQFSLSSWRSVGGVGYPHQASVAEQIKRGRLLQAVQGFGAWPTCAARLGLIP